MKRAIFLLGFTASTILSVGQTQSEMNEKAANDFKKADKELNMVFQKILKEYGTDTIFIRNLKKAQKIWLQLRQAELEAKYPDDQNKFYGSVAPMCWSMYVTELTKERIKKLRIWLIGIEEGDVCSGSVKNK